MILSIGCLLEREREREEKEEEEEEEEEEGVRARKGGEGDSKGDLREFWSWG